MHFLKLEQRQSSVWWRWTSAVTPKCVCYVDSWDFPFRVSAFLVTFTPSTQWPQRQRLSSHLCFFLFALLSCFASGKSMFSLRKPFSSGGLAILIESSWSCLPMLATDMFWIRWGLTALFKVLVLPRKIPPDFTGNPIAAFLTIFLNPRRSALCPYMTRWASLAFTVSQLTHPICTPWSAPLLLLHSARCQKQGRLSLLCVPPPFLHRFPAFHLSYHHSQKSHWGRLRFEARGIGGWGWEEMETRMEGREGDTPQFVDFAR